MFTGIIEEIGLIKSFSNKYVEIECDVVLDDIKNGDSVAVNGVCLTVVEKTKKFFRADVSPETKNVTALKNLNIGNYVNLERAMPANGRFGGHIVSGHVDGTAEIISLRKNADFYDLEILLNTEQQKYVVKKGSIAINGISLTIADVKDEKIKLAIIPHTFENTALKYTKVGDFINIEVDIMAKYIEKFLSMRDNSSRIDVDFLQRNGFY